MKKKYKYKIIAKWFDTFRIGSRVNVVEHTKVIKGKTRHLKKKIKKLKEKWQDIEVIKTKKEK